MHSTAHRTHDRSETNLYDLTPLRELLEPQALQELAERSAGNEKRRKRITTVNVVKPRKALEVSLGAGPWR